MRRTWGVPVSMRSCVRVDVGTMRADPFCLGSHLMEEQAERGLHARSD
jgi:hypothetical protein